MWWRPYCLRFYPNFCLGEENTNLHFKFYLTTPFNLRSLEENKFDGIQTSFKKVKKKKKLFFCKKISRFFSLFCVVGFDYKGKKEYHKIAFFSLNLALPFKKGPKPRKRKSFFSFLGIGSTFVRPFFKWSDGCDDDTIDNHWIILLLTWKKWVLINFVFQLFLTRA